MNKNDGKLKYSNFVLKIINISHKKDENLKVI